MDHTHHLIQSAECYSRNGSVVPQFRTLASGRTMSEQQFCPVQDCKQFDESVFVDYARY